MAVWLWWEGMGKYGICLLLFDHQNHLAFILLFLLAFTMLVAMSIPKCVPKTIKKGCAWQPPNHSMDQAWASPLMTVST